MITRTRTYGLGPFEFVALRQRDKLAQAVCPNATKPLGVFCYSVILKTGVLCYNTLDILCTEEVRKERD